MLYRLYPRDCCGGMIELDTDRQGVEHAIQKFPERFQRYSETTLTGSVMVWAIEYGTVNRYGRIVATAALYPHSDLGLIWIDLC